MPGSEIMLASSTLLLRSDTVIDASGMRLAVTTVSVSLRDACAWTERGDALRRATGLPCNSPLATAQSSAFFSTPGPPCPYSGLEIKPYRWPAVVSERRPLSVARHRYPGLD